ncbi:uncharacterized protein PHACADRAFT_202000 [Phanerochaete carnosa HHB-10118-sp]|uniref:Uncharacterized protein n=1 Tax=Phanerochaete carnosa (strain HHB-10118-sp) TaxID=650164 RepID=K5WFY5_PHACS|nr:uncharacterized protein PHACADRAFT_202000 [Phanerochaete carnosa HHB-10118-sp]EKM49117.1 hypothetical protein PHACADRAFT_202000 [Phanerochaete carnosa HHB-10118-sp]
MTTPNNDARVVTDHNTLRYGLKIPADVCQRIIGKLVETVELDSVCHQLTAAIDRMKKQNLLVTQVFDRGVLAFFPKRRDLRQLDASFYRDPWNRPPPITYEADPAVGIWLPYNKEEENEGWQPVQPAGQRAVCLLLEEDHLLGEEDRAALMIIMEDVTEAETSDTESEFGTDGEAEADADGDTDDGEYLGDERMFAEAREAERESDDEDFEELEGSEGGDAESDESMPSLRTNVSNESSGEEMDISDSEESWGMSEDEEEAEDRAFGELQRELERERLAAHLFGNCPALDDLISDPDDDAPPCSPSPPPPSPRPTAAPFDGTNDRAIWPDEAAGFACQDAWRPRPLLPHAVTRVDDDAPVRLARYVCPPLATALATHRVPLQPAPPQEPHPLPLPVPVFSVTIPEQPAPPPYSGTQQVRGQATYRFGTTVLVEHEEETAQEPEEGEYEEAEALVRERIAELVRVLTRAYEMNAQAYEPTALVTNDEVDAPATPPTPELAADTSMDNTTVSSIETIPPYTGPLALAAAREIVVGRAIPVADTTERRYTLPYLEPTPPWRNDTDNDVLDDVREYRRRVLTLQPDRGPSLNVPNPGQASRRYDRDSTTGPFDLAALVSIRRALLRILDTQYTSAVTAGLPNLLDDLRCGRFGWDKKVMEVVFPYSEHYGNVFLFAEEQLLLRQCKYLWTQNNLRGRYDERIQACQRALDFRTTRYDDRAIRTFRLTGRLGKLGLARELVTYPSTVAPRD